MATIYRVSDSATGRTLALKQLDAPEDARKRKQYTQLFEREFHTLAQLAHPRVVEVYDYGFDEQRPYYTMELLDGGDLQQIAPAPWMRVCALARDVCSALSLLHSRKFVHHDLTPRNIRCTSDGLAKLIDFGAMMTMGSSKQVIGTPAYSAPEAVNLQPLDARADLFALGATLYFTLAGRHAYPARTFAQLRDAWRNAPPPPSELVPGIPAALDALVLDLLQLDPTARPANAAEVMVRLAAIEQRDADEHKLVPQSYLCTPNLVGREQLLSRARMKLMRGLRGRGCTLMIEADPGLGRSRLLSAYILEAKLLGALVLRADATDSGDAYGVMRALTAQLLDAAPDLARAAAKPHLPLLGHVVPELVYDRGADASLSLSSSLEMRARIQSALREWLLAVSAERPLVIAVDDAHAFDEPSAAFLALFSRDVLRRAVVLMVTVQTGARTSSEAALKLLSDSSVKLLLPPLSVEQTEQLLLSVFGDVPHVQRLAYRLQAISAGNPRDVLQIAQHLVDMRLIRYQAGAWSLPASIDAGVLPNTMEQALAASLQALSTDARELGHALALIPDTNVTFEECVVLSGQPGSRVFQSLGELVHAQVAHIAGERYVLAQRAFGTALRAQLDEGTAVRLHLGLARMFGQREELGFREAQQLLRAGEKTRGVDALIAHADPRRVANTDAELYSELLRALPDDWMRTYEQAIDLTEELGRPHRDAHTLLSRLASLCSPLGILDRKYQPRLLARLRTESGLADWDALDASLGPTVRLQRAIAEAQERYNQSPDHERVLEPLAAIRELVPTLVHAVGVVAVSIDYPLWQSLPSLEPFAPLSPALWVVGELVNGNGARITARFDQAREHYARLLERTAQPDRGGLDEVHHKYGRLGVMCGLGMLEASMGLPSCLDWAQQIEGDALHQPNALLIRMLHQMWQGDMRGAERVKGQLELLRIQKPSRQYFEGAHLVYQVGVHAALEDLTRTKRAVEEIEVMARRFPAWEPVRDYGLGEYHRIRGDHASALSELQRALSAMEPGRHQLWPNAAGAYARVLHAMGRNEEARDRAVRDLDTAERCGIGYASIFIAMPVALALSKLDRTADAVAVAEAVIGRLCTLGSKGVPLALAYEVRARVAIEMKDSRAFELYAALCATQFRASGSRLISAKHARLKQTAARADLPVSSESVTAFSAPTGSQLSSMLEACDGPSERARQCLRILLQEGGASAGLLYFVGEHGPELVAKLGEFEVPAFLTAAIPGYLAEEAREESTNVEREGSTKLESASSTSMSETRPISTAGSSEASGLRYRPILFSHAVRNDYVICGVAIALVLAGQRFTPPSQVASELSRIVHESGDCQGIVR